MDPTALTALFSNTALASLGPQDPDDFVRFVVAASGRTAVQDGTSAGEIVTQVEPQTGGEEAGRYRFVQAAGLAVDGSGDVGCVGPRCRAVSGRVWHLVGSVSLIWPFSSDQSRRQNAPARWFRLSTRRGHSSVKMSAGRVRPGANALTTPSAPSPAECANPPFDRASCS